MSDHRYKKPEVKEWARVRYNPVEAVKRGGDSWTYEPAVWNVSAATCMALRDSKTHDWKEWCAMGRMERGEKSRCE